MGKVGVESLDRRFRSSPFAKETPISCVSPFVSQWFIGVRDGSFTSCVTNP